MYVVFKESADLVGDGWIDGIYLDKIASELCVCAFKGGKRDAVVLIGR